MVLQTPATFTSATHYCGKVMGLVFLSLNVSFVTTALDKLVVSLLKKPTRAGDFKPVLKTWEVHSTSSHRELTK